MKMFIEMKTVGGLIHAYCLDCGLDMVLDEKYHSAKMGMDYPANDKDGAMVLASSTTHLHIPPRPPLVDRQKPRSFTEKQVTHNTVTRLQTQFCSHLVFTQTVQAHMWQKDALLDLIL
ncbi:hypothetical protein BU17DRAFT_90714 [Hysterangium stoloniferum]|nr:hypothetical protein BU17DRAFT_90714 [Hysterangium stoloniferum]